MGRAASLTSKTAHVQPEPPASRGEGPHLWPRKVFLRSRPLPSERGTEHLGQRPAPVFPPPLPSAPPPTPTPALRPDPRPIRALFPPPSVSPTSTPEALGPVPEPSLCDHPRPRPRTPPSHPRPAPDPLVACLPAPPNCSGPASALPEASHTTVHSNAREPPSPSYPGPCPCVTPAAVGPAHDSPNS